MEALGRALAVAEDRLRAAGLTGGQAFDALAAAVEERLGLPGDVSAVARAAAASLPLDGEPLGLAYERFFADLFKGRRGQFFTPPPIVRLLVGLADLAPGERVLDPTCGSGALLVAAARRGATVHGIERDPRLARLARVQLRVAGIAGEVTTADFFVTPPRRVDVVVANPPFSVVVDDPAVLARYDAGRGRRRVGSDRLFVEAIEAWVRPGGRAALVLPYSVVSNHSFAGVRHRIDRHWERLAACALPEGVFRPFGGAAGRAVLVWLRRRGGDSPTVPCRWAVLRDPGYDPRRQRVRVTSEAEVEALLGGTGWTELPAGAWAPPRDGDGVRRVRSFATLAGTRVRPSGPVSRADLADADRTTGELHAVRVDGDALLGPRLDVRPGDVLVSRLRPELGNVAVALEPAVGSPEWVVLRGAAFPHWLLHTLRTPTWRAALPATGGQTRPRATPGDVLDAGVAWPGDDVVAAVDGLSRHLFAERAALGEQLAALQHAVDRFAAGEITAGQLRDAVGALVGH
jgi:SAM-dependent methyltransferase